MTQQEILDTITPCIRKHRDAGHIIEAHTDAYGHIKLTAGKDRAFGCSFITDLANVCDEHFIAFAIGAEASPVLAPYILL